MKDNTPNRNKDNSGHAKKMGESIGKQQSTTQTGAQNNGGQDVDKDEDRYTDDLRQSGDRNSSNRKSEE